VITLTKKGHHALESLSLPGKGGDLHKNLQQMIREQAELFGWKATIEERIYGNADSVDVGLEKNELKVAVEVSVTTDADNEIQNIKKCLSAGYDFVICAVSEETTVKALKTKARKTFTLEERRRIRYGAPSGVRSILQGIEGGFVDPVSQRNGANSSLRNQKQLLGVKEAAAFLGVASWTIYDWVSQRKVPHVKVGRLTKFKVEDLTLWLERRTKEEEREDRF
jgi:excisionase family DNA binding protein